MQTYTAPLRDMRFVLHELNDSTSLLALPGLEEVTPELIDSVLEEAGKITSSVLLPLNASGDAEGCHCENGVVRTPKGFKEAYDLFRDGGWSALGGAPEHGGQGLPESVAKLVEEMICSTNLAFGMYPGLTQGACRALEHHGDAALKAIYLPKMTEGVWTGTMCLTEPHCGTDLGLLRTRAEPLAQGGYRITGSKIFISAGEHDLTENIIHLVLARLPDAPPGVRGISLFLVPKFLVNPDGSLGARNGVTCAAIEHKMGIKASATCQLSFDDAIGYLVGEPHKGMRAMFTMMNHARLTVAVQGLGIAEASYQGAVAYARDRLQGRSLAGAKRPDLPADPIIVHPDVRRMLLTIRAYTEGCRALGAWLARELDIAHYSPDKAARQQAEDFVALMTPVAKAMFTDFGYEAASLAVQVYGGHGYIRDHGMEQYVRDARITMLYEGTNGVQALDLVGRKLPANMGRSLRYFFQPVSAFIEANAADPGIGKLVASFAKAFGALQQATAHVAQAGLRDPEEAGAAATEYLRLFGLVALGYVWLRAAKIAEEKQPTAEGGDVAFYQAKRDTARFYIDRLLPQAGALYASIKTGKASMMAFSEAAF
ncbi:MAG TPA: acyl-CoA dehydrogenase C-terminal domain-containing protein [Acetobacteraceae bacterium]|nr:acyl-CoA dehydrogenase C-terminal domain-containing protein [Acetobacteraceae bacterium]